MKSVSGSAPDPMPTVTSTIPTTIQVGSMKTVTIDARYSLELEDLFNFTIEDNHLYANFMQSATEVGWFVMDIADSQVCTSNESECSFSAYPKRYTMRFEMGTPLNRIFVYDWQTRQEILVPTPNDPWSPDIDDSTVVWQFRIPNGWGIAVYNLETEQVYTATESSEYVSDVHVTEDWIGYVTRPHAQSTDATIHAYNFVTKEQVEVDDIIYQELAHWSPYTLKNGRIAWISLTSDYALEVHLMDLVSRHDQVINTNDPECRASKVTLLDDYVFWLCDGHRYGIDLSHDLLFDLPIFPPGVDFAGGITAVLVSQERLVWILNPASKDSYAVEELKKPEALPLQMYTAPIIKE